MAKKLRKGSSVEVNGDIMLQNGWRRWPPYYQAGTVTQVGRNKARVLFPIRSFVWVPLAALTVTGFDGDGSRIGWR